MFDHFTKKCSKSSVACSIEALDNRLFDGLPKNCKPGELVERGQCMSTFYECEPSGRFALVSCVSVSCLNYLSRI